jgi:hypothetical protein
MLPTHPLSAPVGEQPRSGRGDGTRRITLDLNGSARIFRKSKKEFVSAKIHLIHINQCSTPTVLKLTASTRSSSRNWTTSQAGRHGMVYDPSVEETIMNAPAQRYQIHTRRRKITTGVINRPGEWTEWRPHRQSFGQDEYIAKQNWVERKRTTDPDREYEIREDLSQEPATPDYYLPGRRMP